MRDAIHYSIKEETLIKYSLGHLINTNTGGKTGVESQVAIIKLGITPALDMMMSNCRNGPNRLSYPPNRCDTPMTGYRIISQFV